jgi:hypothetical protein
MDHKLGCGICTVISVLKPVSIVGLTRVYQAVTETSYLRGVEQELSKQKQNTKLLKRCSLPSPTEEEFYLILI